MQKLFFFAKEKKKATFEFCLNYSHLNHMTTKGTETHFWGFICRSQKLQTDFQQIWKHLSQTLILTNQLSWKPWKPWNKNKEETHFFSLFVFNCFDIIVYLLLLGRCWKQSGAKKSFWNFSCQLSQLDSALNFSTQLRMKRSHVSLKWSRRR